MLKFVFHLVCASSPFHVEGNVPSSGVKQKHLHWQHGKEILLLSGTPAEGKEQAGGVSVSYHTPWPYRSPAHLLCPVRALHPNASSPHGR